MSSEKKKGGPCLQLHHISEKHILTSGANKADAILAYATLPTCASVSKSMKPIPGRPATRRASR